MEEWGAIEEVLLLDAVEQDGFGNWYSVYIFLVQNKEFVDVSVYPSPSLSLVQGRYSCTCCHQDGQRYGKE